jgi:hypothetical protein
MSPRQHASDYTAQQETKSATIAASRIPSAEVEKAFTHDIAQQYVVVEVAIYPRGAFEINWNDFSLKLGDTVVRVEKPRDVVTPWPEKKTPAHAGPTVITETGVIFEKSSDPVNGRRSGVGTYEGVTVTNDPRASAPPPPPPARRGPDPAAVEQRINERSLPEGEIRRPIAGYLFFPQYGKHKRGAIELMWADEVRLRIEK